MSSLYANKSWISECSDEESVEITVEDRLRLYEKLNNNLSVEFQWKCPGRKQITIEKSPENVVITKSVVEDIVPKNKIATEFEFELKEDEAVTPRRQLGSGRGGQASDKKVASLDKIIKDIKRQHQIESSSKS